MKRYQKLADIKVESTGQTLELMPEDTAMGHIPGWRALLDPDYRQGNNVFNRARHPELAAYTASSSGINLNTFPNGETAFNPIDGKFCSFDPNVAINNDAWSIFAVASITDHPSGGTSNNIVSVKSTLSDPEDVSPRFGFREGGGSLAVWQNGRSSDTSAQVRRITYSAPVNYVGRVAFVMATFSTRDGLKLFSDGELVASAPDDKRPFTTGFAAGQWEFMSFTRGLWGMVGLLDVDLGWPEHAGYRRSVDRFLVSKYVTG